MTHQGRASGTTEAILVWDAPTRLGHWLLAAAFLTAWLTSEGESWKNVHIGAGAVVFVIALFRIIWGFAGSRYARFAEFTRSPKVTLGYLRSLLSTTPHHFVGHNPAGGYVINLLLILALISCVSGYLAYNDIGSLSESIHESASEGMLLLVLTHIAGVIVASTLHRENLIRAMVTGRKSGRANDAIVGNSRIVAVLLLALAGTGYWLSRYL